ncbi:hypothetical protein KDL45_03685 [bacterium]|nr:hypothetical protein [bacterium]
MRWEWSAQAGVMILALVVVGMFTPTAWAFMDSEESSIVVEEPECLDPNTEYRFEVTIQYQGDDEAISQAQLQVGDFWTVEEIEDPDGDMTMAGEWNSTNTVPNVVIWQFEAPEESGRGGVLTGETANFAITATTGDVPTDNSLWFTVFGDVFTAEEPHQIGPTQFTFELCDPDAWETDDDGGTAGDDDDGCTCDGNPFGDDDDRDEGGCSF